MGVGEQHASRSSRQYGNTKVGRLNSADAEERWSKAAPATEQVTATVRAACHPHPPQSIASCGRGPRHRAASMKVLAPRSASARAPPPAAPMPDTSWVESWPTSTVNAGPGNWCPSPPVPPAAAAAAPPSTSTNVAELRRARTPRPPALPPGWMQQPKRAAPHPDWRRPQTHDGAVLVRLQ